jgi:hypothetical protein
MWHNLSEKIFHKILKKYSMTFDYQPLLDSIKQILSEAYNSQAPEIQQISESYLENAENRFKALSEKLAQDQDTTFFFARLKDEASIVQNEVLSLEVIAKVTAQNTLSKIFQILLDFVIKFVNDNLPKVGA